MRESEGERERSNLITHRLSKSNKRDFNPPEHNFHDRGYGAVRKNKARVAPTTVSLNDDAPLTTKDEQKPPERPQKGSRGCHQVGRNNESFNNS